MTKRLILIATLLCCSLAAATVPETESSSSYVTDGSTTGFYMRWRWFLISDVVVRLVDASTGVSTTQTYGVAYTLTGAGTSEGQVVFTTAPAPGQRVVIERVVALTQTTAFSAQGTFRPKTHENAFDKLAMGLQQVDRKVGELADAGVQVNAEFGTVGNLTFSGDSTVMTTARGTAHAWFVMGNCSSSPCSVTRSYNIASVTRSAAGNYTATFTDPASNSVTVPVCNVLTSGGFTGSVQTTYSTTSTFSFQTLNAAAAFADVGVRCVVFGG